MPFEIIRADITTLDVDAIVNAANETLLGGGGVDGAIHAAAGPALLEECRTLGGCTTGEAKITKGYQLPARHVIHTVGPIWKGGGHGEEGLLRSCYKASLELASAHKLESIAFPLISSGVYGYPKDKAIGVAISEISSFLLDHDMMVYLVVFDRKAFVLSEKLFSSISSYIDDHLVLEKRLANQRDVYAYEEEQHYEPMEESASVSVNIFKEVARSSISSTSTKKRSLNDVLDELQETFSEHLLRLIDIKGKTDVETYKKANVDRKLFSKIRGDKHYRPSQSTAIAFSIALELSLDETKDLLQKAGFALSRSSKADLIIEFFIREGNYNIHEINEALFAFDEPLLGV